LIYFCNLVATTNKRYRTLWGLKRMTQYEVQTEPYWRRRKYNILQAVEQHPLNSF